MKSKIFLLLSLSVVMQIAVLVGEYVSSVYPHWTGREVLLKIRPVDPRSLFRGQYVDLNYDINSMSEAAFAEGLRPLKKLRRGEIVFVTLKKDGEHWVGDRVLAEAPQEGLYIQGRFDQNRWWGGSTGRIKYGIEAYFASPERALEIENSVRGAARFDRAYARVMVAANGKAAIKELVLPN